MELEERRKRVRRKADRELLELIEKKTGRKPDELVRQRKRRQVIRHTCKALFVLDRLDTFDMGSQGPREDSQQAFDLEPSQFLGITEMAQDPKTRILDLSEGGASVFTSQNARVGQRGWLQIRVFDGSAIESKVEVRWIKPKETMNGYVLGIKFRQMDSDNRERLKKYIQELDDSLGL